MLVDSGCLPRPRRVRGPGRDGIESRLSHRYAGRHRDAHAVGRDGVAASREGRLQYGSGSRPERSQPRPEALRELFKRAAPCLILIDEWVAYRPSAYGLADLPAGSFDANMTFAQALTEAAKVCRGLWSLRAPGIRFEEGGEAGGGARSDQEHLRRGWNFRGRQPALKRASRSSAADSSKRSPTRKLCRSRRRRARIQRDLSSQCPGISRGVREADYERRIDGLSDPSGTLRPALRGLVYRSISSSAHAAFCV